MTVEKALTMVKMLVLLFWVVAPCGLVGGYKCFRGTHCLHLQGRRRQYVPPKRRCLPTSPYGVATKKTNTDNSSEIWWESF
jgi:hypothetical protein